MAVYFVTGKLGAGKSLASVSKIQEYMRKGKKVATNLDLYVEHLVGARSRVSPIRLPDKPRLSDLQMIGTGDDKPITEYDESKFGLLVLDEMASWFNSRGWAEKSRHEVIEWFLHARKLHWDILFLIQDVEAVDKQLRGSLCEHLVICRRLDRISIPIVSSLTKLVSDKRTTLPKVHVAVVKYGDTPSALTVDRWWYSGGDLYKGYMTGQSFRDDVLFTQGDSVDMRASYSMLSAWHLVGRYQQRTDWLALAAAVLLVPLKLFVLLALRLTAIASGRSPEAIAVAWGVAGPDLHRAYMRRRLIQYGRRLRLAWDQAPGRA